MRGRGYTQQWISRNLTAYRICGTCSLLKREKRIGNVYDSRNFIPHFVYVGTPSVKIKHCSIAPVNKKVIRR